MGQDWIDRESMENAVKQPVKRQTNRFSGSWEKTFITPEKSYGNRLFWKVLIQDTILFGVRFFF
jgi:hypothetical protein